MFEERMKARKGGVGANNLNQYYFTINSLFKMIADKYSPDAVSPLKNFHEVEKTVAVGDRPVQPIGTANGELASLLSLMKPADYIYWPVLCSLYTSMRPGEIIGLSSC